MTSEASATAGAFFMAELIALVGTITALEMGPVTLYTNVDDITFDIYPLSHELVVELATW